MGHCKLKMDLVRKIRKARYRALFENNDTAFQEVLDYTKASIHSPIPNDFIEAQKAELTTIKTKQSQRQKYFAWISFILLCCSIFPLSSLVTGIPHKEFTGNPAVLDVVIISALVLMTGFGLSLLIFMLADPFSPTKVSELFLPIESEFYLKLEALSDQLDHDDRQQLHAFMSKLRKEYQRDMVQAEFLAWSYHTLKTQRDHVIAEIADIYNDFYQEQLPH